MFPSDMATSRTSKWIIGALVGLILLSVQGCWRLRRGQLAARTADSNWQACQQLGEQVADLRQRPALATVDKQSKQELSKSIAAAIAETGSAPDVVRSIDSEQASRIANTSYQRQSTRIELQCMELSAIVSVIQSLVTQHAGLHATAIELKQSSGGGVGDQSWDVGLTLTRLIYAP